MSDVTGDARTDSVGWVRIGLSSLERFEWDGFGTFSTRFGPAGGHCRAWNTKMLSRSLLLLGEREEIAKE